MPPRVSSDNTTPNPKVSSAALRSQTVTSWCGPSCLVSAAKYRPPGPPPMTATRTICLPSQLAQAEPLYLAGGGLRDLAEEDDAPWVLVRSDGPLDEVLHLPDLGRVADGAVAQDDVGRHELPPRLVRQAHDT